jgi:3-oxoacyl-[acyl-carrier protein] reductase
MEEKMGDTLKKKVALVTGGGRGIGEAIAIALSDEEANVAVAGRNRGRLDRVVNELKERGGEALALEADVSKVKDVETMVQRTLGEFGKIDILVNNAGQILRTTVTETDPADWDNIVNVNLRGTFLCSRAVVPQMIRQRGGKIINICSTAGKHGYPARTAYCASKFAVSGFNESLAQEVAEHGITVSSICPGMVVTDMALSTRPGADTSKWLTPKDIADIVVFLATRPSRVLIPEVIVLAAELDYFRQ